ncbi:MAG: N-methylhydantoinase B [Chloroflexi bacterium]|nr:MAG: N-methylhydantoinase B [Chloroflexota bacterium]
MTAVYRRGAESAAQAGFADFAMALIDLRSGGSIIAADVHHPAHFVPLKASTMQGLAVFEAGGLVDGDTIMINDPYKGGGALPDITFATVVFDEGAPRWAAAGRARFTDVAGAGLSGVYPLAWEVYQEGDIIPGVLAARDGTVYPDILRRLKANSRTPSTYESDIKAIVAAGRHGRARLLDLVKQHGAPGIDAASNLAKEQTSRLLQSALQGIPTGSHTGSAYLDSDYNKNENVEIAVTLEIESEGIHLDFSGSSTKVTGPFNSPEANTAAFAILPLLALLPEGTPLNEGVLQHVRFTLPEGSIVNPADPACTSLSTWYTGPRIAQAVSEALSKAAPDAVQQSFPIDPYVVLGGVEGKRGNTYAINPILGWQAATSDADGNGSPALLRAEAPSVEVLESQMGLFVESREFVADSTGAGQQRGAPAIKQVFRLPGYRLLLSAFGEGGVNASPGANGGKAGAGNSIVIGASTPEERTLGVGAVAHRVMMNGDERLNVVYGGGGGWGDPALRDTASIQADVEDGLLTQAGAARDYGQRG